jgi:hypothetical protein
MTIEIRPWIVSARLTSILLNTAVLNRLVGTVTGLKGRSLRHKFMSKIEKLQIEADSAWTEYQCATASVKPSFDRWDKACADLNRETMRQEIREEMAAEAKKVKPQKTP